MRKKLIKPTIITLIFLILALILTLTIVLGQKTSYIKRPAFDKKGFVDYSEELSEKKYTISNDRIEFELDAKTTQFKILDKLTNQIWLSSSSEVVDEANVFNELFVVYYERVIELPQAMSVLDESIKNYDFSFKVYDDGIDILYRIGGNTKVSMIDLPRKIDKERFETLIIEPLDLLVEQDSSYRRNVNFLKAQYELQQDDTYMIPEIKSQTSIELLYDLIFNKSNYTFEDYNMDNSKYNFPTSVQTPYFEFVVSYKVTNNGFRVTLINDSIYETEEFPISYIDILPYFGTGNINDEGFTVIPDGTGIYIDHNNNKYETPEYNKRIYGEDLANGNKMIEKNEPEEAIKLPMYGYAKNNFGFINVIEEGDAMTNIVASFKTRRVSNAYTVKIPVTHYRYNLRERESYLFESSKNKQLVYLWTKDYNKEDLKMEYRFTEKANSYYDFVEAYQEYLLEKYTFKEISNEILHLTFLGGYKEKKNFLGIPYTTINALTKVNQVNEILKTMSLENYSVSFQGWSNGGIRPTKMDKIKFNKKTGSKSEIKKLINEMNNLNIDFYLEMALNSAYTTSNLKIKKEVNHTLMGEPVGYHKYDLATNIMDKSSMRKYYLNQTATERLYLSAIKNMIKMGMDNFAISDDGKDLVSDFNKKESAFKNQVKAAFINNIELLENKNLLLRNSNLYSLIYADKILDLPYEATLHKLADYSIPFLQLALNGNTNYYSNSVNLDTSKSKEWHKLKAIETGSKIQYTLSYKDTVDLVNTEYTDIYSTNYLNWNKEIESMVRELNELEIYNSKIISHKTLDKSGTKVEVKYQNGKTFTIDYSLEIFTMKEGN